MYHMYFAALLWLKSVKLCKKFPSLPFRHDHTTPAEGYNLDFSTAIVREADWEELLSARVGAGRLQVVRTRLRRAQSEGDLWRHQTGPDRHCQVIRLQGGALRGLEYPCENI